MFAVLNNIQFIKALHMILLLQYLSLYQGYFLRCIGVCILQYMP